MHAGEALWLLYAVLSAIGQRVSKNRDAMALLSEAEACCEILGNHIQVGHPPPDQLELRVAALLEKLSGDADPDDAAGSITDGEAREAFDLATGILDDLEDLPEKAADFAESVGEKVSSIREFAEKRNRVTPNQMKALQNIRHGVDAWLR